VSGNNFTSLPATIHELSNLEYLYLDDCKRLQSLGELPSNLKFVSAQACTSLRINKVFIKT
jgi:Leucine-rich repeat (LRR) protein